MNIVSLFFLASSTFAGAEAPIVVDEKRQLFLDDHLVASMTNVTRTIHPAQKYPVNPVLRPTEPWEEGVVILYGSVVKDGDKFRAWYYGRCGVCYAESDDGITWTKPRFDVIRRDGRPTNIVVDRNAEPGTPNALPRFYEVFGVFKDEKEPDPARRYKMGHLSLQRDYHGPRQDPFHGGQRRGLGVAASPDGIHWTPIETWATEAICDGATHWMFDPARNAYVLYGRTKFVAPEVKEAWGHDEWFRRYHWGRAVARVESKDFLHWDYQDGGTAPVVMSVDPEDDVGAETYSMQVFPYESIYIGLVQVFHNRPEGTHLDLQLAVSHDSVHFSRVGDRTPFIPCGGVGSWDRYNNSAANNPPIEVGDELRFYYGGRTYRHGPYNGPDKGRSGGYIGFATVKRDRFVSLDASFDGGTILTKPLQLKGTSLHLNAKADFGEIVVEVLDADSKVAAESNPIAEDGLDIPVAWAEGELEGVTGPVTLRIILENARLFALWCS